MSEAATSVQTLHLQKLCVGIEAIEDLEHWITLRLEQKRATGIEPFSTHTTRMTPKRGEELLAGGSLYWVIKGTMQCRQRIVDLRPVTSEDGIRRCNIVLDPVLVPTSPRPRRPFQGWRYLRAEDAPADLVGMNGDVSEMPAAMQRELAELGLI